MFKVERWLKYRFYHFGRCRIQKWYCFWRKINVQADNILPVLKVLDGEINRLITPCENRDTQKSNRYVVVPYLY